MPDHLAARGWAPRRVPSSSEVRSPLEHVCARLGDLGATTDEIAAFSAAWDDLEPDSGDPMAWTEARRRHLMTCPDAELAWLITDTRDEYALGTTTLDDALAMERETMLANLADQAHEITAKSIPLVMEWVERDPDKARAVLAWERDESVGAQRVSLIARLAEIAGED